VKKIWLFFLFLIITAFLFADWVDISENSSQELFDHVSYGIGSTEVNFALDGYEIETVEIEGREYEKVSYWNEGEFIEIGKPALPRFSRLIAIPDAGNVDFDIIYTEEDVIHNVNIYPRQNLQSESQPVDNKFVIDAAFYTKGDVFPGRVVDIGEPAIMRDFRVVNITVNPFQYDPQTKELRIVTNVDIVVNTSGTTGENIKQDNKKLSRFFEPMYRSTILNYESLNTREDGFQQPCYLFIYPNDATIAATLSDLVDWKHQKGFEVHVQEFNSGTSFYTIKSYIQTAYDTWENPPEFICLVGDAGGSYNIPTDHMGYGEGDHGYVRLEGNDILADAFIGRLSIASNFNLQTIIFKILNYEKIPFMGQTDWYNKALLVGDPTTYSGISPMYTKQAIKEMINYTHPDMNCIEVYSGSFVSQMSSNLNSGVSYFNYRGYWGMSGWNTSHINSLNNGYMMPFAVALTCGTGDFEGTTDCISEAFLKAGSPGAPKGAIGAISTATLSTHTCFNNCVDAGIYYSIFADGIYHMGGALNRGKLNLYLNYPQNPASAVYNFSYWNNLMGDPGLELWTSVSQDMVVNYDAQVAVGTNYLEVLVEDTNGFPLENAWVTALMGSDDIFATGYTDAEGMIILPIDAQTPGSVNLTVTKHNYIPHLGNFDIGNTDRFVNVFALNIDDDTSGSSFGNGDGIVNPGENIELGVNLKNFGTSTANSVTATIFSQDDFITITDATEDYGNIAPGASVYSTDDFDFSIDNDVLGGTEIKLDILIEDALANQWTDVIYIPVEGANLYATDYSVIGDPNGILDPGETVELEVTLENLGTVGALGISGVLSSPDNYIVIDDADGYFGDVSAGGQASNSSNRFMVTANAQVIPGSQFTLELELNNAQGYNNIVSFPINVGTVSITDPVGPDAYGYYCYDDGDIDYYNVPVYDWVEINPALGGSGTNLNIYAGGNTGDVEDIINLPITFRFYGEEYNTVTVCSNGWIAPGHTDMASFMNWNIPGPLGPSPMIAPFWDDLLVTSGDVFWYYDSAQHYIVIEWDHAQNEYNNAEETFQVFLYDSNYYPTYTGDSEIKVQYKVVNNVDQGGYPSQHGQYATVGIEDHSGTIGLEYTFNNSYPTAAKTLQNEMALLFTSSPQYWGFIAGQVTLLGGSGNVDEVVISNGTTYTHPDQSGNYIYPQLPGTYDITASLAGYTSITVNNVYVVENETTVVDFVLEALPIPTGFICNVIGYNDVELIWDVPESSSRAYEMSREANTKRYEKPASDNSRELIGYKVYRDGVEIAEIIDPAILTYTDLALSAGTYEYYVTAIHDLGESLPSNQDDVIITFPAPQNPQAQTQGVDILVTWDEPATRALVYYKVYRNLIMIADDIVDTSYLDPEVPNGTYTYNIRAVYSGGYQSTLSSDAVIEHVQTNTDGMLIPKVTYLKGNHPNPFNPSTSIEFSIQNYSKVNLSIYNIKGQKVKTLVNEVLPAGEHSVIWNGRDSNDKRVSSGVYFYKLKAGDFQKVRKMVLLK
jgi:hypothetical protein